MNIDPITRLLEWINGFHPVEVIIVGGLIGGCAPLLFDIYNNKFSWKSLVHIGFGLLAALLVALIEIIPGNGQLLFASVVAGIGGMSLVRQYADNKDENLKKIDQGIDIQAQANAQLRDSNNALTNAGKSIGVS